MPADRSEPDKETTLREVFEKVLRIPDPKKRRIFLDEMDCVEPDLEAEVKSLIQAHGEAGSFLEESIFGDPTDLADENVGSKVGDYRLVRKLGEGGFGNVFLANQEFPMKRQVAIKILKMGMDTREVIARFNAERQALAMMEHPNIAQIYDGGATDSGRPYFVMELAEGKPITEYCDAMRVPVRQRLELFLQVCDAVQHAHQKGVIHRDLKPTNVVVGLHGGVPLIKVIDFGIAKSVRTPLVAGLTLTHGVTVMGTPIYMSPEQADMANSSVDIRSDVYSLGALLYELLSGVPPIEKDHLLGSGLQEMCRILNEEVPLRPSTRVTKMGERGKDIAHWRATQPLGLQRSLAGDLDWIVIKAIEKERDSRYQTVNDLRSDIRRYLNNDPIAARPPSRVYQFRKWVSRNKVAFTLAWVILVSLLLVVVVSTRSAWKNQRLLARQFLHKGQSLLEQGKMHSGFHWLVKSLQTVPPGDATLREIITDNLQAWDSQWVKPKTTLLHPFVVMSAAITPDGRHVVTGDAMGNLRVWNATTGDLVEIEEQAHDKAVGRLMMSSDGKAFISEDYGQASGNKLWRIQPLTMLRDFGEVEGVDKLVFRPDGGALLAPSAPYTVQLFPIESDAPLTAAMVHPQAVRGAAFSPDGHVVATACRDGVIRFWDAQTGLLSEEIHWVSGVRGVSFSPDGTRLAGYADSGAVRVWSYPALDRIGRDLGHDMEVADVAFHPHTNRLLTRTHEASIRLWDLDTGSLWKEPMRHKKKISSAQFSPDGQFILTTSFDGSAGLWSANSSDLLPIHLHHYNALVIGGWYSRDGKTILTAVHSQATHIWEAPVPATEDEFYSKDLTYSARVSPGGKWLVSSGYHSDAIDIWSRESGKKTSTSRHPGGVWMVRFHPGGRQFASAGRQGRVIVWDVATGAELFRLSHGKLSLRCVDYSRDPKGQYIATGSFEQNARVWRSSDGAPVTDWLEHPGLVEDVQFRGSDTLITACSDGKIRVWRLEPEPTVIHEFQHAAGVIALDLSQDGRFLAAGGYDKVVKLYDLNTMSSVGGSLVQDDIVTDISFSPDSERLITIAAHRIGRIWSVKNGEHIGPVFPFEMSDGSFGADQEGDLLVVAMHRKGIRIIDSAGSENVPWAKRPRLWAEVFTRTRMDESGALSWIPSEEWRTKRDELSDLNARFDGPE